MSIFLLCLSGMFMVGCEWKLIWGLWFKSGAQARLEHLFTPVFAVFPFIYALAFRMSRKKWIERGAITASTADSFSFGLSMLAMFAYMTIYDIAGMAFSH